MNFKFHYEDRVVFTNNASYSEYGIQPSSVGKIIGVYEGEKFEYYTVEFPAKNIFGIIENELSLAPTVISTIIEKEKAEEKNMKTEKIVTMYFDKCEKQLREAVASATTKLYDEDENICKLREIIEEIKKITDQYNLNNKLINEDQINSFCTEETCWRIANINNIEINELNQIKEDKEEILTMISGCETYEQELEILKAYTIVNSDLIMSTPKTYNIEV